MTAPLKETLAANIVLRVPLHRGTIKDIGPNSTDLAFTGTPQWMNSIRGKALFVGGTASQTAFVASTNVDAVQGSVSGWVRLPWASTSDYVFGIGGNNFCVVTGGGTTLRIFHDDVQRVSVDVVPFGGLPGVWFHVVATYLTGGNCVLFINGTQASSAAAAVVDMDPTGFIALGAFNNVGNSRLDGALSGDFTVWDIQLTPAQVSQLYQEERREAAMTKTPTRALPPQPVNTLDNLVGHWTGQIQAGELRDLSGNDNNAVMVSGRTNPLATKGPFGHAIEGHGNLDHRMQVPDLAAVQDIWDGGGTAAFWMKCRSAGEGGDGRAFSKGNVWFIVTQNSVSAGFGDIQFGLTWSGVDGNWETTTDGFAFGEWAHVAITYDSDGPAPGSDPIIYINGVSRPITENSTPTGTRDSDAGLALNFLGHGSATSNDFDGALADMRLYSDILTPAEVAALYTEGENFLAHYGLGDDWEVSADNVTADFLENTSWRRDIGTWRVDDSDGGSKQLTATAGWATTYLSSTQAFGQWEFDIFKKPGNTYTVNFIDTIPGFITNVGHFGYRIYFTSVFTMQRSDNGALTELMRDSVPAMADDTWYSIKITRSASGVFTTYYKLAGAAEYMLLPVTTGSNPSAADVTYTTSVSVTVGIRLDDAVRNFRFSPVIG